MNDAAEQKYGNLAVSIEMQYEDLMNPDRLGNDRGYIL
jgi:hypothetical protein